MRCATCNSWVIGYFEFGTIARERDLVGSYMPYGRGSLLLIKTMPAFETPDIPANIPSNVERALTEAENARLHGLFSAAAGHYRKTIDRAITPLLPEAGPKDMLGQKLGLLKKLDRLPKTFIEWIEIVKDDGNYAMHDDDRDFSSAAEIEPARRFTLTLLQYLFTMPKEVEEARAAIDSRKQSAP